MVSGPEPEEGVNIHNRIICQSYFECDLSGAIKECQCGIIDEEKPLDIIVRLYPIKHSFMNKLKGAFKTQLEKIERKGGLYVELNGVHKTFSRHTMETLENEPAICHFEEQNVTVKVSTDAE